MCSTAHDLLDRLGDDLSQLGQIPAVESGPAGAGDRISALLTTRAKVEALLLDEVAAFDTAGAYVEAGTPTAASWLRAKGRLGRRDASGTVHQARELRELTITTGALSAGSISRAHATEIIKAKQHSHLDARRSADTRRSSSSSPPTQHQTRSAPPCVIWWTPNRPTATRSCSRSSPTAVSPCARSATW